MTLFTLFGLPCFCLLVFSLCRPAGRNPRSLLAELKDLVIRSYARGLLAFLPALVLILFLRRIVPSSYRPVNLFFLTLLIEHLLPFVFALAACILVPRERGFLALIFFLYGFLSPLSAAEILFNYGRFDGYTLFLLPLLRMALPLYLSLLFLRYRDWFGWYRVLFLALILLVLAAAGMVSYLYLRSLAAAAWAAAAAFLAGAIYFLLWDRGYAFR